MFYQKLYLYQQIRLSGSEKRETLQNIIRMRRGMGQLPFVAGTMGNYV